MPSLKELQHSFKRHLMSDDEAIARHVVGTATLSNELRLGIYRHAYRARLEEALASDYEMLRKLVGEEAFSVTCQDYIDTFPSRYFSLRWFGQDFPQWLGYAPEAGSHDWYAEMAQLEWSFVGAFDAADVDSLSEADMAAVPPEAWPALRLGFHPSVRLLPLWWNTLARWRAAKEASTPPEPLRLPQPGDCLLWRQQLTTRYRSLQADEALLLRAALAGADFAALCGALAEEMEEQELVPMQAAGFLKTWLAAGMITDLHY
jgi:hypothetical protein